jgi:imidazoleglycerol-phosphate dehydratase
MKRTASQSRKTSETEINVKLNIDGKANTDINTGIKFLDHMLELFAFFAIFDLKIEAKGDLDIDIHHTNEDIGITLGKALKEALGQAKGIKRFGYSFVPMEECLVRTVVDICGRPRYQRTKEGIMLPTNEKTIKYSLDNADHLLDSFTQQCGINLSIDIIKGSEDVHHLLEAIFKSLGLSLKQAVSVELRRRGTSSTKGIIDL